MAGRDSGQILALSGGGFRGLYTASVIERLEASTGKPFAHHFDLIAGTSIGGILALALAMEYPASRVVKLFTDHGSDIFKQRSRGYFRAKHSADVLKHVLEGVFGEKTLGDCKHPVVIPTVSFSSGEPKMFKTPHDVRLSQDQHLRLVDVALATSAAPTFFPRHMLNSNQYVDGGLVANAPGLVALHEAEFYLSLSPATVRLLSVGTLSVPTVVDPKANRKGGAMDWGSGAFLKTVKLTERLLGLTISANESLVDYVLKHRLGADRYRRVDKKVEGPQAALVGLAKTDEHAREVLLGRADDTARELLGDPEFKPWLSYTAPTPTFYSSHLPSKESTDA